MQVPAAGGEPRELAAEAGSHISFSPDGSRFIDVRGHKVLWMTSLAGASVKLFEFSDPEVRIDYPVWSPDGKWLLFDWFKPKEGDLWLADGLGGE